MMKRLILLFMCVSLPFLLAAQPDKDEEPFYAHNPSVKPPSFVESSTATEVELTTIEFREQAELIFTALQSNDVATINNYLMNLETMEGMMVETYFDDPRERTWWVKDLPSFNAEMNQRIQNSTAEVIQEAQQFGLNLANMQVSKAQSSLKRDSQHAGGRVRLLVVDPDTGQKAILVIGSLFKYNDQWYMFGGMRWQKRQ